MDAPMRAVDNELAPAISQQPGFIGFFALDDDGGTLTMISIFEDQASAARSNELSAAFLHDRLDQFGSSGAEMSSGEVLVGRVSPHALRDAHPGTAPAHERSASAQTVSQRPVLVVGATGRTGRLIVDRLLEMGLSVHALLRDAPKRREPLPSGVRQFTGDVRNSQTLIAPMEGVGSVIIASSGGTEHRNSAELVDYFGTSNLVLQAAMSNVGLVVLVSTLGATRAAHAMDVEPTSLGWKAGAEEVIRRSGVPYCIVRCGWLTDGPGGEPLSLSPRGRDRRTALATRPRRSLDPAAVPPSSPRQDDRRRRGGGIGIGIGVGHRIRNRGLATRRGARGRRRHRREDRNGSLLDLRRWWPPATTSRRSISRR